MAGVRVFRGTGIGAASGSYVPSQPSGLVMDPTGNLYYADLGPGGPGAVVVVQGTTGTVFAGAASGSVSDGVAPTATTMSPWDVKLDARGNVYISDNVNHAVRVVNTQSSPITIFGQTIAAGNIQTVAGTLGVAGGSGPSDTTHLNYPAGIALDGAGNLYVADSGNSVIRRVAVSNGAMTVVAGVVGASGSQAASGALATSTALSTPTGVALDPKGNLYFTDIDFAIVGMVNMSSSSFTYAPGASGGTAVAPGHVQLISSNFNEPSAVAVDAVGNVYVTDFGLAKKGANPQAVRHSASNPNSSGLVYVINGYTGVQTTLAGTSGSSGATGSSGGVLATSLTLSNPAGIALDPNGNVLFSESNNADVQQIYWGAPFYGTYAPANGTQLKMNLLGIDSANIFVQLNGNTILADDTFSAFGAYDDMRTLGQSGCVADGTTVNSAGTICMVGVGFEPEFAGVRTVPLTVDDVTSGTDKYWTLGLSGVAVFPQANPIPMALATVGTGAAPAGPSMDGNGYLYFADYSANVVYQNGFAGTQTVYATLPGGSQPTATAPDPAGNVFVTEYAGQAVAKVDVFGNVTTYAGGTSQTGGDGSLAVSGAMGHLNDAVTDPAGNLYVVDQSSNKIRFISALTSVMTTIAGTGTSGAAGDGGPATAAQLNSPTAIALDWEGNLFIADNGNCKIREVNHLTGTISTVAGTSSCVSGTVAPGNLATSTALPHIDSVAVDAADDIYFTGEGSNGGCNVFQVNAATGIVSSIAGLGNTCVEAGDNYLATLGSFYVSGGRSALRTSGDGSIFLSSFNDGVVRVISYSFAFTCTNLNCGIDPQRNTPGNRRSPRTNLLIFARKPLGNEYFDFSPAASMHSGEPANGSAGTLIGQTSASQTLVVQNIGNANNGQTMQFGPVELDGGTDFTILPAGTTCVGNPSLFDGAQPQSSRHGRGDSKPGVASNYATLYTALAPGGTCAIVLAFAPATTDTVNQDDYDDIGVFGPSTYLDINLLGHVLAGQLTVTAGNTSISYGTQIPSLGYSITGFINGDTVASATTGQPSLSTTAGSSSAAGTYPITVSQGSLASAGYTFNFVSGTLTIVPASTNLSITSVSPGVSAQSGTTFVVTYSLQQAAPGAAYPSGSVLYSVDGGAQQSAALSGGIASLSLAGLAVGTHTISASYGGDANYSAISASSFQLTVTAKTAPLFLSLSPVSSYYLVGETVMTSVATLAGSSPVPTGTVACALDSGTPQTLTLVNGGVTFPVTGFSAGAHAVNCTYAGDTNWPSGAIRAISLNAIKGNTAPTATVAPGNPVGVGTATSVNFSLAGPPPGTGTITCTVDSGTPQTVTLTAGAGTLSLGSSLAAGAHTVACSYAGDSNYNAATLPSLTVNVTAKTTLPTVTVSPANPTVGQTVTVAFALAGPPAGTGTITCSVDGGTSQTATLTAGAGTLTLSNLTAGSHTLACTYSGDSNYAAGTLAPLTITVAPAIPTPTFTAGGLVSSATYTSAMAPGSLATLFGTNLAASATNAPITPLPATLGGVSVTINGVAAPLLYVSPTQINLQIPFETPVGLSAVVVTVNGVSSTPANVTFAANAPGIFSLSGATDTTSTPNIVHALTGLPVTSASPATAGEYLVVAANGAAITNPPADGATAPLKAPFATTTATPTASLQGTGTSTGSATVLFSALAPGFVGALQVNIQLPATLPANSGTLGLTLTYAGANSQTVTLYVH